MGDKRKIFIFAVIFLCSQAFVCFSQETVTVSTYYPAPEGVYNLLRLFPHDDIDPTAPCANAGQAYYDNSESKVYICNGATWETVAGSSFWDLNGDVLYPIDHSGGDVAIGKNAAAGTTELDVAGKFKANNMAVVTMAGVYAPVGVIQNTATLAFGKTFDQIPVVVCTSVLVPAYGGYPPAGCSIEAVTTSNVTVRFGTNRRAGEYTGFNNQYRINVIAIDP